MHLSAASKPLAKTTALLATVLAKTGSASPEGDRKRAVRLDVRDGDLILTAIGSDGLDAQRRVPLEPNASGDEPVYVDGHVLRNVLAATAGDTVELELAKDGQALSVSSGPSKAHLPVIDGVEIDLAPFATSAGDTTVPFGALRTMLQRAARHAAPANGHAPPPMRALRLHTVEGRLRAVGTDGFRLAYDGGPEVPDLNLLLPVQYVKPALALLEPVARKAGGDEEGQGDPPPQVTIELATNGEEGDEAGKNTSARVTLSCEGAIVRAGLAGGDYPAYERLLPTAGAAPTRIDVDAAALRAAAERASLLSDEREMHRIDVSCGEDGVLRLDGHGSYGHARAELPAALEGQLPDPFAVNARYLADALTPIEGTAHIAITKPGAPFIITTDDQVGYLAMVVPLRRDGAR